MLCKVQGLRDSPSVFKDPCSLKSIGGYCDHLRPSVMLSPPKLLDEIQQNLACVTHMNGVCNNTFILAMHQGPCRGIKRPNIISVSLSVVLSPPKQLDEIQPNLVCELLTRMRHTTAHFLAPSPEGPGEGSKGQISCLSVMLSHSKELEGRGQKVKFH